MNRIGRAERADILDRHGSDITELKYRVSVVVAFAGPASPARPPCAVRLRGNKPERTDRLHGSCLCCPESISRSRSQFLSTISIVKSTIHQRPFRQCCSPPVAEAIPHQPVLSITADCLHTRTYTWTRSNPSCGL